MQNTSTSTRRKTQQAQIATRVAIAATGRHLGTITLAATVAATDLAPAPAPAARLAIILDTPVTAPKDVLPRARLTQPASHRVRGRADPSIASPANRRAAPIRAIAPAAATNSSRAVET